MEPEALLEPGETLRAAAPIGLAHGDTGPVSEWEPVELSSPRWLEGLWASATRTTLRKVVLGVLCSPLLLWVVVEGLGSSIGDGIERLVGGVVCRGPRGSTARRVQHALSALGPGADHLVVTDRRLVFGRQRGPAVLALDRDAVAAVRRRRRLLLNRRLDVAYTDGSVTVLAVPLDPEHLQGPARLAAVLMDRPPAGR